MADKTTSGKKTSSRIPEDARHHYRAAREELRAGLETLLPEGLREHHRKARKEMLLAWRSMLDAAIQHLDEKA